MFRTKTDLANQITALLSEGNATLVELEFLKHYARIVARSY